MATKKKTQVKKVKVEKKEDKEPPVITMLCNGLMCKNDTMCGETSPEGYVCRMRKDHTGMHIACAITKHNLHIWR